MSRYTDRVEANLKGLEAVSTGLCGGCTECAEAHGVKLYDEDGEERAMEDVHAEFEAEVSSGKAHDEGSFSWSSCGICDSRLGGDRYVWHALMSRGTEKDLVHFDDACTDCVFFLADGDEPEEDR